jgi:hypothetical protein
MEQKLKDWEATDKELHARLEVVFPFSSVSFSAFNVYITRVPLKRSGSKGRPRSRLSYEEGA